MFFHCFSGIIPTKLLIFWMCDFILIFVFAIIIKVVIPTKILIFKVGLFLGVRCKIFYYLASQLYKTMVPPLLYDRC